MTSSNRWAMSFGGSESTRGGTFPLYAMLNAPTAMTTVPTASLRVNTSPGSMRQLRMELKISPIDWRGERMISGRVVIWINEPRMLATMKSMKPKSHMLRLYRW